MNWTPIILSLKLALISTVLLLLIALPIAFWLSRTRSIFKPILEAIISLPLVLPPTVLGFYLLLAFSPGNAFGSFIDEHLGLQLVFSFEGLVVGSIIYSLPFMIHPIQSGLSNLPGQFSEASYVIGKSKWTTLFKVLLPNIKPSLIAAIILSFAHTLGEFGVVLMIGGNIESETRVASIAIYDEVESMNYSMANYYSATLLITAFLVLLVVYSLNRKSVQSLWK